MDAVEQRSAAWLFERAGKATASRFADVMARGVKGGYLKARQDYLWELVVERIKGGPVDHYTSTAMQWGIDNEPAARMAYETRTGAFVEIAGFVPHPTIELCGGSPDGLIGDDGGCEFKSPFNSAIHLQTILDGMPAEHVAQVQGNMAVNGPGRLWWDFNSYDPRQPEERLQLYTQRIARDDAYIATLEAELRQFLSEVDALVARLRA